VLWARKRQPEQIAYLAALAHERFTPPELIRQAEAAEAAGFDGICCSDHLAPWWAPGDPAPAESGADHRQSPARRRDRHLRRRVLPGSRRPPLHASAASAPDLLRRGSARHAARLWRRSPAALARGIIATTGDARQPGRRAPKGHGEARRRSPLPTRRSRSGFPGS
jgi:hypothetical protein